MSISVRSSTGRYFTRTRPSLRGSLATLLALPWLPASDELRRLEPDFDGSRPAPCALATRTPRRVRGDCRRHAVGPARGPRELAARGGARRARDRALDCAVCALAAFALGVRGRLSPREHSRVRRLLHVRRDAARQLGEGSLRALAQSLRSRGAPRARRVPCVLDPRNFAQEDAARTRRLALLPRALRGPRRGRVL